MTNCTCPDRESGNYSKSCQFHALRDRWAKGDRVEWWDAEKKDFVVATVTKGGRGRITAVIDGGKTEVRGGVHAFRASASFPPSGPPSVMDRWGITAYKQAGGEETPRFECWVTLDGKRLIRACNDGCGGPNHYHGEPEHTTAFLADCEKMAEEAGVKLYEPADFWLNYYVNQRPYGVTLAAALAEEKALYAKWDEEKKNAPPVESGWNVSICEGLPSRYTFESGYGDNGARARLTDVDTGKSIEVGLCDLGGALKVLRELIS